MKPIDMIAADINSEYLGVPRLSLMENAGRAIADEVRKVIQSGSVAIFCGPGGNGGDGLVAARHLLNMGFEVEVTLLSHPSMIKSAESIQNWRVLEGMLPHPGVFNLYVVNDSSQLSQPDADLVVDAVLGTGVKGAIREPARSAIELINRSEAIKISVDVPSGFDPEKGTFDDVSVHADVTVTFHKIKEGLLKGDPAVTGEIIVRDIGLPAAAETFLGPGDLIRIPRRTLESHKGDNGRVLIVGGSREYSGAPALAGLAALRAGADVVTIACPESVSGPIKSISPDLIVRGLRGDYLSPESVDEVLKLSENADSVLIGCGAGLKDSVGTAFRKMVPELLKSGKNVVLDADGLKHIKYSDIKDYTNLIITPHMGEFKEFFSIKPAILTDLNEKITAFQSISSRINGVVLLKGRIDMIFQGDKFRLNRTGSPGMTVGGTGDCLAGLTAALTAMGLSQFESASLAAFINGKSGEIATEKFGNGLMASDVIRFIPEAMEMGTYF